MNRHLAPLLLPFRPGPAARSIRSRPAWGWAFALLAAVVVVCDVVSHEEQVRWTLEALPPSVTPAQEEEIRVALDSDLPRRVVLLPAQVLVTWWLKALVLMLLLRGMQRGISVRLKQMLGVVIGAEGIPILDGILQCACRAAGLCAQGALFPAPWGLPARVILSADSTLAPLLTTINMSTLWYVGVMGWGVSVLTDINKRNAFLAAAALWIASAGTSFAVLHFLRTAYGFQP